MNVAEPVAGTLTVVGVVAVKGAPLVFSVTLWAVALLLLSVKLVDWLLLPATVLLKVPLVMVRAVLAGAVPVAENDDDTTFWKPVTAAVTVPLKVPATVGAKVTVKFAVPLAATVTLVGVVVVKGAPLVESVTDWGEALLLVSVKLVDWLLLLAAVLLNVPLVIVRAVLAGDKLTGAKATPRNSLLVPAVAMAAGSVAVLGAAL